MKKIFRSIFFIVFLFSLNQNLYSYKNLIPEDIYSKISEQYLKALSKPNFTDQEIESILDAQNPSGINQNKLNLLLAEKESINTRKKILLNLFKEKESKSINYSQNIITDILWQDLELFCGQHDLNVSLLNKLNRAQTETGTICFARLLVNPSKEIKELTRRQVIIKELIENKDLFEKIDQSIKNYKKVEAEILSFWDDNVFSNIFGSDNYFPMFPLNLLPNQLLKEIQDPKDLDKLNSSSTKLYLLSYWNFFLTLRTIESEIYGIKHNAQAIPESFKALPIKYQDMINFYGNLGTNFNKSKSFLSFTGDCFGHAIGGPKPAYHITQLLLSSLNLVKTLYSEKKRFESLNSAYEKLKKVATGINTVPEIKKIIDQNEVLKNNINNFGKVQYLLDGSTSKSPNFDLVLKNLTSNTFKDDKSFIAKILLYQGKILSTAYLLIKTQNYLTEILQSIGEIDAYLSIAKLYKEREFSSDAKYSFAQYETNSAKPYIKLDNFWTPFIDANRVITNNIEIGGNNLKEKDLIISGPNAGGKSTILKAIAINLLLAQTITIVPADYALITPFGYIDTYLNITDDIASGNSLFKSEVLRVKNLLKTINEIDKKEFSFVIMDEIFSGTNPREGEAAGYAIGKYLSKIENNIALIASHFSKLTNLEQDTNNIFKNYKVVVNKTETGSLVYPFKIEPGKTDQTIAIEILKQENFDPEIISDAYSVI